jgi:hypothetical protein
MLGGHNSSSNKTYDTSDPVVRHLCNTLRMSSSKEFQWREIDCVVVV